jgi:hypothetical protein
MDFFVNAIGDVFAWIFLSAVTLTALLLVGAVTTTLAAAAGAVPSLAPAALWMLSFVAALTALLGLAGDYVQRIYRQSSGRPFFLVRRVHGTQSEPHVRDLTGARR